MPDTFLQQANWVIILEANISHSNLRIIINGEGLSFSQLKNVTQISVKHKQILRLININKCFLNLVASKK